MKKARKNDSTPLRLYALSPTEFLIVRVLASVSAGFPSPADDYFESEIDLNKELIRNPDAAFVIKVNGDSMTDDGIESGNIIIVDRSLEAKNRSIAVCCINNEFTLKRLEILKGKVRLLAANPLFEAIEIHEGDELIIWGIATHVIKEL